jgi:hypothetical protein
VATKGSKDGNDMTPKEVLAVLDRLGITVWWQQISADLEPGTYIRYPERTPLELRAAIDEHTETLLKIMERRPGQAPGIYHRPPKQAPGQ